MIVISSVESYYLAEDILQSFSIQRAAFLCTISKFSISDCVPFGLQTELLAYSRYVVSKELTYKGVGNEFPCGFGTSLLKFVPFFKMVVAFVVSDLG